MKLNYPQSLTILFMSVITSRMHVPTTNLHVLQKLLSCLTAEHFDTKAQETNCKITYFSLACALFACAPDHTQFVWVCGLGHRLIAPPIMSKFTWHYARGIIMPTYTTTAFSLTSKVICVHFTDKPIHRMIDLFGTK